MTSRDEIIRFALTLPGASADQPFENDFETTVLRHGSGGRWFGLILSVPARYYGFDSGGLHAAINLKCEPEDSFILRELFESVRPAYHMNKRLWITALTDADLPDDCLFDLIRKSYSLTLPRSRHRADKGDI